MDIPAIADHASHPPVRRTHPQGNRTAHRKADHEAAPKSRGFRAGEGGANVGSEAGVIEVLAAPIGSGLGIRNPYNILEIVENAGVPILVDAGVGTASDAAVAMELGCDGVLMNTAIAAAQRPVLMASAMRKAIEAGREAFLAGRIPRKRYASASSPLDGVFF